MHRICRREDNISLSFSLCLRVSFCVCSSGMHVFVCRTDIDRELAIELGPSIQMKLLYTHSQYYTLLAPLCSAPLHSALLLNPIEASDKRTQINFAIQHCSVSSLLKKESKTTNTRTETVWERVTDTHIRTHTFTNSDVHKHKDRYRDRYFSTTTEWIHHECFLRSYSIWSIWMNNSSQSFDTPNI